MIPENYVDGWCVAVHHRLCELGVAHCRLVTYPKQIIGVLLLNRDPRTQAGVGESIAGRGEEERQPGEKIDVLHRNMAMDQIAKGGARPGRCFKRRCGNTVGLQRFSPAEP